MSVFAWEDSATGSSCKVAGWLKMTVTKKGAAYRAYIGGKELPQWFTSVPSARTFAEKQALKWIAAAALETGALRHEN